MPLGSWGRFLVMIAGGSIVVAAILIVACFVGPGCWGFEYLQREDKRKKNLDKIQIERKSIPRNQWFVDTQYIYKTSFDSKICKINESGSSSSRERVFNLKCAPLLVAPTLYSGIKPTVPKLNIKLFYSSQCDEGIEGRLTVQIISTTVLPPREYITTLDPFVGLEILNNKWSLQKNERIVHVVQTKPVKNSLSPIFDETFVFDVKKIDLKNLCLKFTIYDDDRLTRVTPLFERRLHLKELKDLTTPDHISLGLDMQEVSGNLGALFFGISYLPTAQRLNITVIKASKLKFQTSVQSVVEFCPYVRVVMVNNNGKCLKKKKTNFRPRDESPVFNHSLVFDLSISNLEQTVFLLLLCTKVAPVVPPSVLIYSYNKEKEIRPGVLVQSEGPLGKNHKSLGVLSCQPADDSSSLDGDIETSLAESKDKVLGTIVLGRNVRCTRARDHWVSVMQNPRKMISVWHDLR